MESKNKKNTAEIQLPVGPNRDKIMIRITAAIIKKILPVLHLLLIDTLVIIGTYVKAFYIKKCNDIIYRISLFDTEWYLNRISNTILEFVIDDGQERKLNGSSDYMIEKLNIYFKDFSMEFINVEKFEYKYCKECYKLDRSNLSKVYYTHSNGSCMGRSCNGCNIVCTADHVLAKCPIKTYYTNMNTVLRSIQKN